MYHFQMLSVLASSTLVALLAVMSGLVLAQDWKPDQTVEIIVAGGPGSGPDVAARAIQRIFQTHRILDVPISIQNKTGGGGAVLRNYLKQFEGNGHYLVHSDKSVLSGHAIGRSNLATLTPVAILFGEYIGVAVKADSPVKSGRDLVERLKKDPAALSIGLGVIGTVNHQGLAEALMRSGIAVGKTRNVTFNAGAPAVTALLGGHVDVVPVSLGSWAPHLKTGAVRVVAVSSAERLPGIYSVIPTWREQGIDAVVFNWRAMFGARGMSAAQIAYWEGVLQRVTETPEWKIEMERRNGVTQFIDAAAMRKRMDEEYPAVKAMLVDLQLAKP